MFEKQSMPGSEKLNASSSSLEDPPYGPPGEVQKQQDSLNRSELEDSEKENQPKIDPLDISHSVPVESTKRLEDDSGRPEQEFCESEASKRQKMDS